MGRIETTMGPWKTPAGRHGIDVRHIATFLPCSTCQRRTPASSSAHSNVNEQPSRNATRSSRQYGVASVTSRSEEHTSELQSQSNLVCRLLLEKKKKKP